MPNMSKSLSGSMFSYFQFLEQIGFSAEPYHLVGISMASLFQDEIHSVTMICPASKYKHGIFIIRNVLGQRFDPGL